jgi:RNA polymerase sigma factor (sigma-70 family)
MTRAAVMKARRLAAYPETQSIESVLALCDQLSALAPDLSEVAELIAAVRRWADERRNQRVMENTRLVHSQVIGNYFFHRLKNVGIPLEDATQEGLLGLYHAATLFDEARGWVFSTYAHRWIFQAIQGYFYADRTIRAPDHAFRRDDALAKLALKVSRPQSLDRVLPGGGKNSETCAALVPDPRTLGDAEGERIEAWDRQELIAEMMRLLSERDWTAVWLRFGEGMQYADVVKELHRRGLTVQKISKERIRQIVIKAVKRAREWAEERKAGV